MMLKSWNLSKSSSLKQDCTQNLLSRCKRLKGKEKTKDLQSKNTAILMEAPISLKSNSEQ